MAFKGMNPEEGREVAQGVTDAGQQILEVIDNVTGMVNSVEWIGPDYDTYRDEWNSFTGGAVGELVNALADQGRVLVQHAEQQDSTSNLG